MPLIRIGVTRCTGCGAHLFEHQRGGLAWCINPKCRQRDQFVAIQTGPALRSNRAKYARAKARKVSRGTLLPNDGQSLQASGNDE